MLIAERDAPLPPHKIVLRRGRRPPCWAIDMVLATALLLVVVGVTALYVRHERVFYWYDLAGYHNAAVDYAAQFRSSPAAMFALVRDSLAREYNGLYIVPLLPVLLVLGDSRPAYVVALAVAYLLPFVLTIGAVAARLSPTRPRAAFWSAVAVALLTPPVWLPTLRGYPDTGAAALIGLAAWCYLRDTRLRRWWQLPAIGASVAAAMLFRRHFAYAGAAFFGAAGLQVAFRCALEARRRPRRAARELLAGGVRLGLAGAAALGFLLVFGRAFLAQVATADYTALYASYMRAPGEMLRWTGAAFGWLCWGAAAAGLALGAAGRARVVRADGAAFVTLLGGLSALLWVAVARQPGPHYTLHFSLAVVLGLTALGWMHWWGLRGRRRVLALGALATLLATNALTALAPLPHLGTIARPALAAPAPPLVRDDRAEVARLVGTLRELTPDERPIYVAASSDLLNRDIIANAERALYGRDAARLALLDVPEIDSRDFYPLEPLLRADYVVVVEPYQYHLPAERQDVVRAVGDLFRSGRGVARDFERLPARFALQSGATVTIHRRAQPSDLATSAETLSLLRAAISPAPGGQAAWQAFRLGPPTAGRDAADGSSTLTTVPVAPDEVNDRGLIRMLPIGEADTLVGRIAFADPSCAGVALRLARTDAGGRFVAASETTKRPADDGAFALAVPGGPADLTTVLVLSVTTPDGAPAEGCLLTIEELRFTRRAAGR